MQQAVIGDRVRIQYSRLPAKGTASDKPPRGKEIEFTVGSREVFRGLSLNIVGMAAGDQKQLTLQPREAYGPVQPKLIRRIPRERIPKHIALRVGKRLTAVIAGSGCRRQVKIVKIESDSLLVDGNHPLAGKVIELDVRLISIDSSAPANRRKSRVEKLRMDSPTRKKVQ